MIIVFHETRKRGACLIAQICRGYQENVSLNGRLTIISLIFFARRLGRDEFDAYDGLDGCWISCSILGTTGRQRHGDVIQKFRWFPWGF